MTSPLVSTLLILSLLSASSLSPSNSLAHAAPSSSTPMAPHPVGGFAICNTGNALHIQGGVSYSDSATFLVTTNQHFRLDLSQPFSYSSSPPQPPTWVNLTSDYSPFQRFHAGACATERDSFLTVGSADADAAGDGAGFMRAYSLSKGTWSVISQAVSGASSPDGNNGGKGNQGGVTGAGAGRTMVAFAMSTNTSTPLSGPTRSALGVVVGGGWLPPKMSSSSVLQSARASDLVNLATEIDITGFGLGDSSVGSMTWTVTPNTGHNGNNANTNLGSLAGSRVIILPGGTQAVVLGGVTSGSRGQNSSGLSFANLPIVELTTGAVTIQRAQKSNTNDIPTPRYGHCAALSADGNSIYMFGGALVNGDKLTNDLYELDLRTWTWLAPWNNKGTVPSPVRDHQCIIVGEQLLTVLGFNSNQAPASSGSTGAGSTIPPTPNIYVYSTTSLNWINQFTPLPGIGSPPPPPNVPTDGSKGKISGVGIAFGVIFGLAIVGVIAYLVWSHRRSQQRKRDNLLLLEMEQKKKLEEKQAKEQQKQSANSHAGHGDGTDMNNYYQNHNGQQQPNSASLNYYADAPLPSTPPVAHLYSATYQPMPTPHDPFQNPAYYQSPVSHPLGENPYYSQANGARSPFESQSAGNSPPFVLEEMGHSAEPDYKVPVPSNNNSNNSSQYHNNLMTAGARDKTSFIEPSSSYR
ncbi:hypothetical protein MVEG_10756 [Podila verticillata NRRL 6337]|nr:hypothetical protein MVEG_10756 [Podila verticillata NRRL 6337]